MRRMIFDWASMSCWRRFLFSFSSSDSRAEVPMWRSRATSGLIYAPDCSYYMKYKESIQYTIAVLMIIASFILTWIGGGIQCVLLLIFGISFWFASFWLPCFTSGESNSEKDEDCNHNKNYPEKEYEGTCYRRKDNCCCCKSCRCYNNRHV